ncbi:RNA polymerase sigma factor [Chitinophaga rhizophila]|uniref:Sigma-70 family RNA polymerase sigma factor n=1 Tax=Chitinophaga rhizophila TaxID=2866212 RepID=A0ABS7G854_9BACT|nr:sigma-70 family RNA polymerase sigma factor [Chitinophaga rhizophila]MBW8683847.1 sigma-70 family RNA polymerase sigma factor [Chitinophaga rhizophila]
MTEAEYIKEAKKGSSAAQKWLFDELSGRMLMVCRRYVRNEQDAEELMLDGFCKFYSSLSGLQYQGSAALFSWVKRIMINECLMFLRKKHTFVIVSEHVAETLALQEDILDNLSAAEIFNLVIQLPAGYRTVFNLYVIEGMNHGEIAALLGISEGTSKSQLSKAKSLLQKMLLQQNIEYGKRKTQQ